MPTTRRKLVLTGLILAGGLCAAEAGLRWAGIPTRARIPDERLRDRPNPRYPDHDRRGYRNPEERDRAQIVALGDSQTYGTGVASTETWTWQLESVAERSVYNIAFGGWGPAHSLLLYETAREFEPEVVIAGVYLGNDLYDAFDLVYGVGSLPELASEDPALRARIEQLEEEAPLLDRILEVMHGGNRRTTSSPWVSRLLNRSRVYTVLRRILRERMRNEVQAATPQQVWGKALERAKANPGLQHPWELGDLRTVFTAEYRSLVMDQEDPRVAEGLRITCESVQLLADKVRADGRRFLVLLIPTKESTFREVVVDRWPSYETLLAREDAAAAVLRSAVQAAGIEWIDAAPALRAALARGEQPYHTTHDGHLNVLGHRIVAELVGARLE